MKYTGLVLLAAMFLSFSGCRHKNNKNKIQIYGWNILTDHMETALKTIEASKNYEVNQLQLSHEICHDLRDIKHQWNRNIVNNLTRIAHEAGITEVLVWDHALYNLGYYPDRFKLNGLINLDDPGFWEWFKDDYRKMLDKIPEVNGIVLTFIETGARVENQFSEIHKTPQEKLAALVDSVASVVVNERKMKLYIRSFMYNKTELNQLLECFRLIKCPKIIVMEKEVPHDFFVTHPVSTWIQEIPFPVIIEFDCAHEFNGQGNVASFFPEIQMERWKYYLQFQNVIGFSIRTDRYGKTSILNRPPEINLYAIHETTQNPSAGFEKVLEKYLTEKFDSVAVPYFKEVFQLAPDIILSSFYTLGLNTTNHSKLDFDYRSIYTRHVSGRWMDRPEIFIGHDVNRNFHYWSDIVNHLAPAQIKVPEGENRQEIPEVLEKNWIQPEELMDTIYLNYILTEKKYGVTQAYKAIAAINAAKPFCTDSRKFNQIYHTFNRTLLSARLRKAYAQVYYANRIWNRGKKFQDEKLMGLISEGIQEIKIISKEMKDYRRKGPEGGQYEWIKDADIALSLAGEIEKSGLLPKNE
jgi:hypothetical protein